MEFSIAENLRQSDQAEPIICGFKSVKTAMDFSLVDPAAASLFISCDFLKCVLLLMILC